MRVIVREVIWHEVEVSDEELLAAMPEEVRNCDHCSTNEEKVRHWVRRFETGSKALVNGREKLNVEVGEAGVVGVNDWVW